jgi:hypothetical protein
MGIERRRFNHIWRYLAPFWVIVNGIDGDTLLQERMQEELERTIAISKVKGEAGKKGGQAYAQAQKEHMPTHSHSHSQLHKEKREKQPRKKRAAQLSSDWILPDDYKDYCKTKRPELNPDVVAENFKDYYLSHGKPMVDWKRTWQRWVRSERAPKTQGFAAPEGSVKELRHPIFNPDNARKAEENLDDQNPYADLIKGSGLVK